jgi:hypothetical protein
MFLKKVRFRNAWRDPKFSQRRGLVVPNPGREVPERRSELYLSEKELPGRRSVRSTTKMPLLVGKWQRFGGNTAPPFA